MTPAGDPDPWCPECRGRVKSATVSFSQVMDPTTFAVAEDLITVSDAMRVIGSSLTVYPAAGLPELATERGMGLAIINDEPTPLDHLADVLVHGRAAEVLAAAVAAQDPG